MDLSPSTVKYNYVFGDGQKKLELEDDPKSSPSKVRFNSKSSLDSPLHTKYRKSPSSASLYQFSVTGKKRPINQVIMHQHQPILETEWQMQQQYHSFSSISLCYDRIGLGADGTGLDTGFVV